MENYPVCLRELPELTFVFSNNNYGVTKQSEEDYQQGAIKTD